MRSACFDKISIDLSMGENGDMTSEAQVDRLFHKNAILLKSGLYLLALFVFFHRGSCVKFIFHLATLFARREAKARIRRRGWLTLVSEKIRKNRFYFFSMGNGLTRVMNVRQYFRDTRDKNPALIDCL